MTVSGHSDPGEGAALPPLISALTRGACFDHPTDGIVVLQTHISYVLLTGPYAYKIKKPVILPFLDFSSLADRKHYCDEELRINRRLASELYVDVVPITGTPREPHVNGSGKAIEYAVKMVQFPDSDRLDRVADRGELQDAHIQAIARKIADFHDRAGVADRDSPFADSEHLRREVMENFAVLSEQDLPGDTASLLEDVRSWSARSLVELAPRFRSRKHEGKVRECHGDMHLANMALLNDQVTIFDALEFNENFRWIDVQSELAFLAMDLDYRGLSDLGWLLVDGYLAATGDYAGLRVFRHYKVYRAMVRAKVAALRAGQFESDTNDHHDALAESASHVELAHDFQQSLTPTPLIITHGLSGSGKSWVSERLARVLGAIRVRSDVVRQLMVRNGRLRADGLYTVESITRAYSELEGLARIVIECGYPAIVDATFLKHDHRDRFASLAKELGVPLVILAMQAPASVLEARVASRAGDAANVSEATVDVLRGQRRDMQALSDEEREASIEIDTEAELDVDALVRRILRGRSAPLVRRLDYRRHSH